MKLKSGRLALVSGHRSQGLLNPSLTGFFSWRAGQGIRPEALILKEAGDILSIEEPANWGFDPEMLLSLM